MASSTDKCILVGPFPMEPGEDAECCVACHLSWEEQYVLPYLPPEHRRWILREHAFFRNQKKMTGQWPRQLLVEHAHAEDQLFGHYLPAPLLERMKYEHLVLDHKIQNGLPLDD